MRIIAPGNPKTFLSKSSLKRLNIEEHRSRVFTHETKPIYHSKIGGLTWTRFQVMAANQLDF